MPAMAPSRVVIAILRQIYIASADGKLGIVANGRLIGWHCAKELQITDARNSGTDAKMCDRRAGASRACAERDNRRVGRVQSRYRPTASGPGNRDTRIACVSNFARRLVAANAGAGCVRRYEEAARCCAVLQPGRIANIGQVQIVKKEFEQVIPECCGNAHARYPLVAQIAINGSVDHCQNALARLALGFFNLKLFEFLKAHIGKTGLDFLGGLVCRC